MTTLACPHEEMLHMWNSKMQKLILMAAIVSLSGCRDERVTSLEKRVENLEQAFQKLEAQQNKSADEDAARRAKLESCVSEANAEFQSSAGRNGTRQANSTYNIPLPLLEQMQRQRQAKIEECRLLYSK